eukprot:Rhum_TRINITY_DN14381_c0_g1::Rhum_TRINITY_DN14381_c0_g1_i1::g.83692::m.83692/K01113/phoD; alkaline phosphatase D
MRGLAGLVVAVACVALLHSSRWSLDLTWSPLRDRRLRLFRHEVPAPWQNATHWETPFIAWKDTEQYADAKQKDRPVYLKLQTAMLRTVLHDRAVFWGRNPDGQMRVFLAEHAEGNEQSQLISWGKVASFVLAEGAPRERHWAVQSSGELSNTTDYTAVVPFTSLTANTYYDYVIQLELNGTWHNHLNGTLKTFPKPGEIVTTPFVFGFGSCLNPVQRNSPTGQSVALLESWGLRFFLFIGDFIYFWDELPHTTDEYNRYYYRKLVTREVAHAMRSTPWMFQFDDHEIHNDWVSEGHPSKHKYYAPAMRSYNNLLASANPPINSPVAIPSTELPYVKWYTLSYGNFHYFVLDTRSYKVNRDDLTGPLLGDLQKAALVEWVRTKCRRADLAWCFLVSPTIFTHGSYRKDLWFGNMKEQAEVKAVLEGTPNVTSPVSILSGDSHIAAIWEVGQNVHEFTCSPVDAFGLFYPWAKPPRFVAKPPKGKKKQQRRWHRFANEWPKLGDLDPPKQFYAAKPRHLGPAGYNCLIESQTVVTEGVATVSVRFDIIDGHKAGGKLLHSHFQNYSHPLP